MTLRLKYIKYIKVYKIYTVLYNEEKTRKTGNYVVLIRIEDRQLGVQY